MEKGGGHTPSFFSIHSPIFSYQPFLYHQIEHTHLLTIFSCSQRHSDVRIFYHMLTETITIRHKNYDNILPDLLSTATIILNGPRYFMFGDVVGE